MELLQKLTLYDLLGYTLPGGILVLNMKLGSIAQWISGVDKGVKDVSSGLEVPDLIIILIMGYFVGIVISEAAQKIVTLPVTAKVIGAFGKGKDHRKKVRRDLEQKSWKDLCRNCNISDEQIRKALQKAGLWNGDAAYGKKIYSYIQINETYKRIHNYASMELLCKNMSIVCLILLAGEAIRGFCSLWLVVYGISIILFGIRWHRFRNKKDVYSLIWFMVENGKQKEE
ncbi:MAG: hypothetical protein HDR21_08455 [Lachnospiraceae bacterium]|nr:hypothetical protein [Lachnospiraceae bacterium]